MKTQPHFLKSYLLASKALILCSALVMGGCSEKEDTSSTTTTAIYIAGHTQNNSSDFVPCYWKNDTRTDLPVLYDTEDAYAEAIYVEGNIVYTAGSCSVDPIDLFFVPCYWKNDVRIDLPTIDPILGGKATAIYATPGAVFTGGYSVNPESPGFIPCYWINETRVDLPTLGPGIGFVEAIQVVGSTIYTAGVSNEVPCYWVNDTLIILPVSEVGRPGWAYAIKVVEDDVYVAGSIENTDGEIVPCFWVNGNRTDLSDLYGTAYGIDVVGKDIYTAGINYPYPMSITDGPYYWKNRIRVGLPVIDATRPAEAHGIQVMENTIYTAGFTNNNSGDEVPCYWLNHNNRVDLPVIDPTKAGQAKAIQVVLE